MNLQDLCSDLCDKLARLQDENARLRSMNQEFARKYAGISETLTASANREPLLAEVLTLREEVKELREALASLKRAATNESQMLSRD